MNHKISDEARDLRHRTLAQALELDEQKVKLQSYCEDVDRT